MEAPVAQKPYEEAIEKLIAKLRRAELPEGAFNLYRTTDPELDLRGGAAKRRENLRRYLKAVRDARWLLVGLAPGYRGARFTGIPFTDEHRLCFPGSCYDRTSSLERPYREATAGVVMDLLGARNDVACWNVFPWHPHEPSRPLSNAKPDAALLEDGKEVLEYLLHRLFSGVQVVAVGEVAESVLTGMTVQGVPVNFAGRVRHPSYGGANEFRQQISELLGLPNDDE